MIYKPHSAQFEITEICTHSCRHCYNYFNHNTHAPSTSSEIIDAISNQEIFDITLTGGDPLCKKHLLYESIEKFKDKNMDVRVNSNLHLLKKEDVEKFVDYDVDSVLTSVLGNTSEMHDYITGVAGSFNVLIKSLEILATQDVRVAANMVVNKTNKDVVYNTAKLLFKEYGIQTFCATPVVGSPYKDITSTTLTKEEYVQTLDTLLKLEKEGFRTETLNPAIPCMFPEVDREEYRKFYEKRNCGAGKGTMTFSAKGDVRVCSQEGGVYGNILENDLEQILENMKDWRENKFVPKECSPCTYIELCRGGCRVSAESHTGRLDGIEPYFTEPIKTPMPLKESEKIEFERLKAVIGNVRLREEGKNTNTLYINGRSNAVLTNTEIEVFKRFFSGKSFEEVLGEVKNKSVLEKICTRLKQGNLLTY